MQGEGEPPWCALNVHACTQPHVRTCVPTTFRYRPISDLKMALMSANIDTMYAIARFSFSFRLPVPPCCCTKLWSTSTNTVHVLPGNPRRRRPPSSNNGSKLRMRSGILSVSAGPSSSARCACTSCKHTGLRGCHGTVFVFSAGAKTMTSCFCCSVGNEATPSGSFLKHPLLARMRLWLAGSAPRLPSHQARSSGGHNCRFCWLRPASAGSQTMQMQV